MKTSQRYEKEKQNKKLESNNSHEVRPKGQAQGAFWHDQANLCVVEYVSGYMNLHMLKFIELYAPKRQFYCMLIKNQN